MSERRGPSLSAPTIPPETKGVFDLVKGLTEVDPQQLADFRKAMTDKVIPEIVEVVEQRRLRAAESRRWQLKC
jgi:hypothetical protein